MSEVFRHKNDKSRTCSAFVIWLPNQGSNLDFTDPESVVLPITPLGIVIGCKNTLFLNAASKMRKKFFGFFANDRFSVVVES